MNLTPQLPPAHLERLPDLAVEITRRFRELRERGYRGQPLVADNRAIRKISHPTPFENPDLLRLRPSRPRCEDSAAHLKRHRINFQHRETPNEDLPGVKEVVIVDFRAVAEYPALWVSVRLRRLAFDQVMTHLLPLVRRGQIGIVERDH